MLSFLRHSCFYNSINKIWDQNDILWILWFRKVWQTSLPHSNWSSNYNSHSKHLRTVIILSIQHFCCYSQLNFCYVSKLSLKQETTKMINFLRWYQSRLMQEIIYHGEKKFWVDDHYFSEIFAVFCWSQQKNLIKKYIYDKVIRPALTENVHRVLKNIWFLYVYLLCFHVCFAFMFANMYAFIWYQTCTLSEHSKIEFHFKRSKNGIM